MRVRKQFNLRTMCAILVNKKNALPKMPFHTLVLSGGSVKGVGLLGALEYVNQYSGLEHIKYFYGTSAGSVICVLAALGFSPPEMFYLFQRIEFRFQFDLNKSNIQLLDYNRFDTFLKNIISDRYGKVPTLGEIFETTGRELHICTYNYTQNKLEVFSPKTRPYVPCLDAVRLSCALPFIFGKTVFEGDLYFDGGIVCNLPLEIAVGNGHQDIIAFTLPSSTVRQTDDSVFAVFSNLVFSPIERHTREAISKYGSKCTLVELHVDIPFTQFNVPPEKAAACYSECYFQCQAALSGVSFSDSIQGSKLNQ